MFLQRAISANKAIYSIMTIEGRRQAKRHMLLLGITGLMEMLFLVSLVPVFNLIASEDETYLLAFLTVVIEFETSWAIFGVGLLALVVNLMRILLVRSTALVAYRTGEEINNVIMVNYLGKPYYEFSAVSLDEILSAVVSKVHSLVTSVIQPSLTLIGNVLIAFCLVAVLFLKSPFATVLLISAVFIFYGIVFYLNKERLQKNGRKIAQNNSYLSYILRSMRVFYVDCHIENSFEKLKNRFYAANHAVKESEASNMFLSQSPRYIFEGSFFVGLFGVTYFLFISDNLVSETISVFMLFGIAGMRLFPVSQQTYFLLASIRHGMPIYDDLRRFFLDISSDCVGSREVFNQKAVRELGKVEQFNVEDFSVMLANGMQTPKISLEARKGDLVTIVGHSGIGKSSVLRGLLGLVPVASGGVSLNGLPVDMSSDPYLRARVGYVSQFPMIYGENLQCYLEDGINDFDTRVAKEVFARLGLRFDMPLADIKVSEFGENFSGGERQRIALAKCLLNRRKELLVLDEFTSALDMDTQRQVLGALEGLCTDRIVITVSHRPELIRQGTLVVEMTATDSVS